MYPHFHDPFGATALSFIHLSSMNIEHTIEFCVCAYILHSHTNAYLSAKYAILLSYSSRTVLFTHTVHCSVAGTIKRKQTHRNLLHLFCFFFVYINFMDVLFCLNLCLNYICGHPKKYILCEQSLHLTHDKECIECASWKIYTQTKETIKRVFEKENDSAIDRIQHFVPIWIRFFCCCCRFFFVVVFFVHWKNSK